MTHDELLAELNDDIKAATGWKNNAWLINANALRAVIELHKQDRCDRDCCEVCLHCYNLDGEHADIWPCPTIQAIEKELK